MSPLKSTNRSAPAVGVAQKPGRSSGHQTKDARKILAALHASENTPNKPFVVKKRADAGSLAKAIREITAGIQNLSLDENGQSRHMDVE